MLPDFLTTRMSRRYSPVRGGSSNESPVRPPRPPRVKVPAFDNSELMKIHALTAIGRLTNPSEQKVWSLIPFLADHWKFSSRPIGANLGNGLFQFQFASEQDLVKALKNQPYHFSHWMVILQRWEPTIDRSFPSQISFWINVQGIPVHLWSVDILESIADSVGKLELSEVTPTYFRMRVAVNGLKPLVMKTIVEFADGSEIEATLVYEKLQNFCKSCHMLDHVRDDCPLFHREEARRTDGDLRPRRAFGSHSSFDSRRLEDPEGDRTSRSRMDVLPRNPRAREGHQTDRSRRFQEEGGAFRRREGRDDTRERLRASDSPRRSFSVSEQDPVTSLSNHSRDVGSHLSQRRHFTSNHGSGLESRHLPSSKDKGKGIASEEAAPSGNSAGWRRDGSPVGNLSRLIPAPPPLAKEAVQVALSEVRDVMLQYANPTESTARRERIRQAEELGEFEETAEQMVRASLPDPPPVQQFQSSQADEGSSSQGRIPASQRLGPVFGNCSKTKPRKKTVAKRKPGRPPGKRASPKQLVGAKSRNKQLITQHPVPRRRLIMDHHTSSKDSLAQHQDANKAAGSSRSGLMNFRNPSNRLT